MRFKKSLALCIGLVFAKGAFAQTLQDTLLQTLQTNPNILVAVRDHCSISEDLKGAKAGYLPTLDANAGYGREHTESPFASNVLTSNGIETIGNNQTLTRAESGLALNQPLFDGFATKEEVARNQARLNSADYKILGTAQDVALNAVEAYINVLKEQQLVKLAQNNLSAHQKILDMIQKRSDSGIDQSADLTQAQGRLALARANLLAEQGNLTDAESNYVQIVGEKPANLAAVPVPAQHYLPSSEDQAVQWAVNNHPLLKSAQEDMQAAYAQHKESNSKNYPHFAIQLSANRDSNVNGIEGIQENDQAMLRANYNLFNGGADKAQQNSTAYLYQEASEVMHKTYREVVNNAQLSWNAYQTASKQLPQLKSHRDSAAKTFTTYGQQFQLGKRSLLDDLDAQNESFEAARAYIAGEYNETYAKYRVLNSTGSLIQSQHINYRNAVAN